mmetsp:Transcript_32687/g.98814  ORF Transcript_32687/g.98814 Transcript_32687/m.98814 type:complete len:203 (-) Transcript_32687:13-621(-)
MCWYLPSHVFRSLSKRSAVLWSNSLSFPMRRFSRSLRSVRSAWKAVCKFAASLATMELLSSMSRMYCSRDCEKSFSTESTREFTDATALCNESKRSRSPASNLSWTVAIWASNMPCKALLASTRRLISAFNVFSKRAMLSRNPFACNSSASLRAFMSMSICRSNPLNRSVTDANLDNDSGPPSACSCAIPASFTRRAGEACR